MNRELNNYCISCRHCVKVQRSKHQIDAFCTRKENLKMLGVPSLIKAGRFPVAHQFSCRFHLMRKDKIKAVIVERQTKAERRRKLSIAQMKRRHRERAEKARKGL